MATGRPSSYKPEFVDQALKLSLLGARDQDLADFFEVNVDSIYEWKKKHPEFSEALKNGKAKADAEIAKSLYQRALGYEVEEKEDIMYKGAKHTLTKIKHIPPDVTSMIFWLKNRRPADWRDKQEIELKTNVIEVVLKE